MCESCKGVTDVPLTLDVIPTRDVTLTLTGFVATLLVLVSVRKFVMRVLMWNCNDDVRRDNHHRGSRTSSNQQRNPAIFQNKQYHDRNTTRNDYHHYFVDLFGAGSSNRPGRHHQDSAVSYALGRGFELGLG